MIRAAPNPRKACKYPNTNSFPNPKAFNQNNTQSPLNTAIVNSTPPQNETTLYSSSSSFSTQRRHRLKVSSWNFDRRRSSAAISAHPVDHAFKDLPRSFLFFFSTSTKYRRLSRPPSSHLKGPRRHSLTSIDDRPYPDPTRSSVQVASLLSSVPAKEVAIVPGRSPIVDETLLLIPGEVRRCQTRHLAPRSYPRSCLMSIITASTSNSVISPPTTLSAHTRRRATGQVASCRCAFILFFSVYATECETRKRGVRKESVGSGLGVNLTR